MTIPVVARWIVFGTTLLILLLIVLLSTGSEPANAAHPGVEPAQCDNSQAPIQIVLAARYAIDSGFQVEGTVDDSDPAVIIVAIAWAESGGNPLACNNVGNNPPDSWDRGILQINDHFHPEVSNACAFDPRCSFQAARNIGFCQWATYEEGCGGFPHNGAYRNHLFAARQAVAQALTGVRTITNPDPYTCSLPGFITFENIAEGTNLSAGTIAGVRFTTTDGETWRVGDFATGLYNGKYPNGGYTSQGTHWAWLGTTQPRGRLDFPDRRASYFSLLVSDNLSPVSLDAYDSNGNLLSTAGPAPINYNTGHMAELRVVRPTPDIAYIMVHDRGNYFLVDSICTDTSVPRHIEPGARQSFFAAVAPGQAQATFSSNWAGSDIVMTLTTPSGRVIDRNTVAPDVSHEKGSNFELYTVANPESGDWTVSLFGENVPPSGEDVMFRITTVPTTSNRPPLAHASGPYTGSEGSPVAFDGTDSSDPDGDALTFVWDFGDGSAATGATPSHTYADNGVFNISLIVTDPAGLSNSASTTATIGNVAPTVDAGPDQAVKTGTTTTLAATFADPGVLDTHTATIDWGDGTVEPSTVTQANGSGTVSGAHAYINEGLYTVKVTVKDDDGGEGTDTLMVKVDGHAPSCVLTALIPGPPTQIQVTAQDSGSGIAAITVLLSDNATVSVPPFVVGTTGPIVVTATKINQSLAARVVLEVRDRAANITTCDPVITEQVRNAGKPVSHIFSGIPKAESKVTIYNSTPGLTNLSITVNGKKFEVAGLKDNEVRTVDVSSAMVEGNKNTIILEARGKPGGSAVIMIHD